MAQPQQPDAAQQVMQHQQRPQVLFDAGGPAESVPSRAVLLHRADHRSWQPPARGEFDPVGDEVEQLRENRSPGAKGHHDLAHGRAADQRCEIAGIRLVDQMVDQRSLADTGIADDRENAAPA